MRLRLKIYTAHCKFFYTSFCIGEFGSESNCCFAIGVPTISTAQCSAPLGGEHMEPAFITYARQLCKAVAEEANQDRVKALLDELAQLIDEHQLLSSLL